MENAAVVDTRSGSFTNEPFGLQATGAGSTTSTSERWTARWDKRADSLSGLFEMGVRPYDVALGRFLSVDPVVGGSLNNYEFAAQDPINNYDLDGRFCLFGKKKGGGCKGKGWWRKYGSYVSMGLAAVSMFTPAGWITASLMVASWGAGQASVMLSRGTFSQKMAGSFFNLVGAFLPGGGVMRAGRKAGLIGGARLAGAALIAGNYMMGKAARDRFRDI